MSKYQPRYKSRPARRRMLGPNRAPIRRRRRTRKIPDGVPRSKRIKLKYIDYIALTSTSGALTSNEYRGNSIYDPDDTGTGSQPYGFDEWAAFYHKYTVTASKIKVKAQNVGTTSPAQNIMICLTADNTDGPQATIEDAMAQPIAKAYIQSIHQAAYLQKYCSTAKIVGRTPAQVASEDNFSSLVTTNPTNLWNWTLYAQSLDKSTTTVLYAIVECTFYVKFFEPKELALG